MKKFLAIHLLSLFTLSAFCQHAEISFSEEFKIKEQEYKNQTVGNSVFHNDHFYTATNSGIGGNNKWLFTKLYDVKFAVTIAKFDKNMKQVKNFELENGEKVFGPLEPQLILLNGKLLLAYFQTDDKSSFNLNLALLHETSLTIKETKKICTIQQENVGVFKIESVIEAGLVHITKSPDNTKMLLACKTAPNTLQTFVVDDQFNLIKQTKVPAASSTFDIASAVLTNDNRECLVLSSEQGKKIVCISEEGKKSELNLKASGDLFPSSATSSISKDGKYIYICSTTMLPNRKDMGCSGLLLTQIDCNNLKQSKTLEYAFSPEFTEKVCQKGGGLAQRKKSFMFDFKPGLIEMNNGNLVILGSPERLSISKAMKTSYDLRGNRQEALVATTQLEVGPVIAIFPEKNGKSFDYTLIARNIVYSKSARSGYGVIKLVQAPAMSKSFSSFIADNKGDEIIVLYNDDEKNLAKGENEKIVKADRPNDLVLAEAVIGGDKKLKYRKQFGKNLNGNYTYFLGNTIQTTSSSVIFPIGKEGVMFNARKLFFTNWCFVNIDF